MNEHSDGVGPVLFMLRSCRRGWNADFAPRVPLSVRSRFSEVLPVISGEVSLSHVMRQSAAAD